MYITSIPVCIECTQISDTLIAHMTNRYDGLASEQTANPVQHFAHRPNDQLFAMVLYLGTRGEITSMLYCPFKLIIDY